MARPCKGDKYAHSRMRESMSWSTFQYLVDYLQRLSPGIDAHLMKGRKGTKLPSRIACLARGT